MTQTFPKWLRLSALLVFGAVGAICAQSGNAAAAAVGSEKPVAIGIPLPLSGPLASFGIMMRNSFELAREAVNARGGINGRALALHYVDDQGRVDPAVRAVDDLHQTGVAMLVGGFASDPTYAMARRAETLDMPFLVCTASADKITQAGLKNIYRLNPPISEYTQCLEAFFIKELKPRAIAIVYEDSMFGTSGAMRMMSFCTENAIEIRALIGYRSRDAAPGYFRPRLAPLLDEPPDVIYMISYLQDGIELVKAINNLNIPSQLCGGAGGFTQEDFIRRAGPSAERMLTASLWSQCSTYPGAREYFDAYTSRFGSEPDYHGAEAYSALLVAADALERASQIRADGIRAALDKTYLPTPFGPVKFYSYEKFERQNSLRTLVLQIVNGQFRCIWPLDVATAPYVAPAGSP